MRVDKVNGSGKILFSEVQRFPLLFIMPLAFLFFVACFLEAHMIVASVFRSEELWAWALAVSIGGIVLNIFITIVLIIAKLQTRLEETVLYIRFFPFHLKYKEIDFNDIASAYARTYQPLSEFGGWGIRWSHKGKAYNVSGNRGLQLEFKTGKKILIGSQHADEFAAQLKEAMFHSRLSDYTDETSPQDKTDFPEQEHKEQVKVQ